MKAYTLSQMNKKGYSGIAIKNLLKLDEIVNSSNASQIMIVNSVELFKEMINLGTQINKFYNGDGNQVDDNGKQLAKEWINKNYFPYVLNKFYEYGEHIYEYFCIELNNIYMILQLSQVLKSIIEHKTISPKTIGLLKELTVNLNTYEIICNYWNGNVRFSPNDKSSSDKSLSDKSSSDKSLSDKSSSDEFSLDNFVSLNNNCQINKDNKDIFSENLLDVLINYTFSLLERDDYMVKDSIPLLDNISNPKYFLYKYSNCLMGIIYYELLNKLTSNTKISSIKSCYYCKQLFIKKYNNQHFCEDCMSKGIPKKLRDKKYNDGTRKEKRH